MDRDVFVGESIRPAGLGLHDFRMHHVYVHQLIIMNHDICLLEYDYLNDSYSKTTKCFREEERTSEEILNGLLRIDRPTDRHGNLSATKEYFSTEFHVVYRVGPRPLHYVLRLKGVRN